MKIRTAITNELNRYVENLPLLFNKTPPPPLWLGIRKQSKKSYSIAVFTDALDLNRHGYDEIAEVDINDCISIQNAIDEAEFYAST